VIVIPAIDVLAGRSVRLRRGDYGRRSVYAAEPAEVARSFIDGGAGRLHVVDLDAARGRPAPRSRAAVEHVLRVAVAAGCEVQVGGGVRSVATATRWLRLGASAVVLGTVAVRDAPLAAEICRVAEHRVLLALDARDGSAQAQGWTEGGGALDAHLERWRAWPAAGVVYTDVDRDGVLAGPNLDGLRHCLEVYGGAVYASGGVTTAADIEACARAGAAGVILGRALHDGVLSLADALSASVGARS
jgi:phosphoribosylformimino-5-aminoimidazole carboxamide ribotide isomerase